MKIKIGIALLLLVVCVSAYAVVTFQGTGTIVQWTNSGSAVVAGDLVSVGNDRIGVAQDAIAASASGPVGIEGVYTIAKASGTTFSQGARLWWSGTAVVTSASSGYYFIGYAAAAGTNGKTTCLVRLRPYREEGRRYLAVTDDTTVSAIDTYCKSLVLDCNVTTKTVTLPAVADCPTGAKITVKKRAGSGAAVLTIDGNASEQVEGGNTFTSIDAAGDLAEIENTGAAWIIVNRYIQ